ncbi:MAG: hypothetical protein K6L76_07365 [Agarilytica sp.]
MTIHSSAELIEQAAPKTIKGERIEVLTLKSGQAIALSHSAIALYRNASDIGDPLGNGLLYTADIPEAYFLKLESAPWVKKVQSGYIGLDGELALLVLPNEVKLYRNNHDALKNIAPLASLPLE